MPGPWTINFAQTTTHVLILAHLHNRDFVHAAADLLLKARLSRATTVLEPAPAIDTQVPTAVSLHFDRANLRLHDAVAAAKTALLTPININMSQLFFAQNWPKSGHAGTLSTTMAAFASYGRALLPNQ